MNPGARRRAGRPCLEGSESRDRLSGLPTRPVSSFYLRELRPPLRKRTYAMMARREVSSHLTEPDSILKRRYRLAEVTMWHRAALLLLVGVPRLVAAQQPDPPTTAAALALRVRTLDAGALVRLAARPHTRRIGTFGGVRGDTLYFAQDPRTEAIPLGAIDTLWTRGRRTGSGALIGAVVLAVPTAILANALCGLGEGGTTECGSAPAAGAVLGGAVGAGLGALIGHS